MPGGTGAWLPYSTAPQRVCMAVALWGGFTSRSACRHLEQLPRDPWGSPGAVLPSRCPVHFPGNAFSPQTQRVQLSVSQLSVAHISS